MKELTNLTTRALPLSDGTILAAAGTAGCVKQVENVSEDDARRLGDSIFVRDVEVERKEPVAKNPAPAASPATAKS